MTLELLTKMVQNECFNFMTLESRADPCWAMWSYSSTSFFYFFIFIICKTQQQNIKLLPCVSYSSSAKSFAIFDVNKLLRMIEFYPNNFIDVSKVALRTQLKNYVTNVRSDPKFAKLKGLSNLCAKHVETNKCNTFAMVYKL